MGYEFVSAITADTARGGFQPCPADACEPDEFGKPKADRGLFDLRDGFQDPLIDRVTACVREHKVEIAGFEFIETIDGRSVVYDVNTKTNTNYNPDVKKVWPKSGPGSVGAYLKRLLAETRELASV